MQKHSPQVAVYFSFFHPDQIAQLKNKRSAYTAGSLTEKIKAEAIVNLIEQYILSDAPAERIKGVYHNTILGYK